jgi:hypothetical protein
MPDAPISSFRLLKSYARPLATPRTYLRNLHSIYMISKTDREVERLYIPMDLHGFMKLFDNLPFIESISIDSM